MDWQRCGETKLPTSASVTIGPPPLLRPGPLSPEADIGQAASASPFCLQPTFARYSITSSARALRHCPRLGHLDQTAFEQGPCSGRAAHCSRSLASVSFASPHPAASRVIAAASRSVCAT